jgi:hypothetical protein
MKRTFLPLVVLFAGVLPATAQLPLSFGLRGGMRLTDFTEDHAGVTKQDHVYTIGPYAELHLPLGFSLQGELLYKRSGATLLSATEAVVNPRQFSMDSFTVPILLKKRLGAQAVLFHPFLEGGLANRYSTGLPADTTGTATTSGWQEGLVLGGGVETKVLMLKLSGELRWTHYGNIDAHALPKLNANEAELLFGLGL